MLVRRLGAGSVVVLALGGATLIGARVADDSGAVRSLKTTDLALRVRAAGLETERDRLRAERDQLEAQLAARRAPPVCPQASVSTDDLIPTFTVDYPCGWHVLYEPRPGAASQERPGLRAEITLISRLPISLAPRTGPAADIEIVDWTDDPSEGDDRLLPLQVWVAEEHARFSRAREERIEAGSLTAFRVSGTIDVEEPVEAVALLWEYKADRIRHVVRVFVLSPSPRVHQALDRMIRSFDVREG